MLNENLSRDIKTEILASIAGDQLSAEQIEAFVELAHERVVQVC